MLITEWYSLAKRTQKYCCNFNRLPLQIVDFKIYNPPFVCIGPQDAHVEPLRGFLYLFCASHLPPCFSPTPLYPRLSPRLRGSVVSASGPQMAELYSICHSIHGRGSWTRDPIESLAQSENGCVCVSVCMSLVKAFGVCHSHVDFFSITVLG